MELAGKKILVVGGSGVFGAKIVDALAKQGASVLATCSTNESAIRIPDLATLKLLLDLTSSQSVQVLVDYLNQTHQIDGLVLAAGRVGFAATQETNEKQLLELMQINFLGQSELIRKLLPNLLTSTEPFLIAITGIVAEKVFPGMSAYCASKKAMSSFLDSVRMENAKTGLTVLEAQPGHTETGLATRPLFGTAPKMPAGMHPDRVVAKILSGLENRATILRSTDFS